MWRHERNKGKIRRPQVFFAAWKFLLSFSKSGNYNIKTIRKEGANTELLHYFILSSKFSQHLSGMVLRLIFPHSYLKVNSGFCFIHITFSIQSHVYILKYDLLQLVFSVYLFYEHTCLPHSYNVKCHSFLMAIFLIYLKVFSLGFTILVFDVNHLESRFYMDYRNRSFFGPHCSHISLSLIIAIYW